MSGERKDASKREQVSRADNVHRRNPIRHEEEHVQHNPVLRDREGVRKSEPLAREGDDEAWRRDRRGAQYPADTPTEPEPSPQAILGAEAASLRQEWETIQAGFVDEPRQAVERADALVARAAQRLADSFAHERGRLEEQWGRGGDVSTEDLRRALRRYRAFFDRLLSI